MAFNFSPQEFEKIVQKNASGVLFKKISSDILTPVASLMKVAKRFEKNYFLLESAENNADKGNSKGRFSVLGFMPDLEWQCKDGKSFVRKISYDLQKNSENILHISNTNEENFVEQKGDVLQNLRQLIEQSKIDFSALGYGRDALPAMCGGIFGYMGYDMVRYMEKVTNHNLPDPINVADSIFIRPQIIVVFDNLFDCALICAPFFDDKASYQKAENLIEFAQLILSENIALKSQQKAEEVSFEFSSNYSKEEYVAAVEQAKKYIIDGDIFQVLPSQRFTANYPKTLPEFMFYRALRSINPSPFLFFLKFSNFAISGSSPEIMASLKDNKVTIRPLAGTRKRGNSLAQDALTAEELLKDEKEIAEHLMLIDLGRHDVGRVSEAGTVAVTKKMQIEYYSHVMHISSTVEGQLKKGCDALDVLVAGFPAGTVSGAPKIRAMEIIEEIEPVRRSFYAGCVGYFSGNGTMETCITLRSALIKDEKIYLQAGAGVVFDSDPVSEYQECINKAAGLVAACEKIKEFI